MTYLSLGEAAKAAGVAKGTISKALKSGKLSYVEKTTAGYQIDPAELFRVFPRKQVEVPLNERLETQTETPELAVLRVRLEAAEQRAIDLDRHAADLAKQLDRVHDEKLRLMALLPAPPSPPAHPAARRSFWPRLFGRQGDSPSGQ